MSTCFPSIRLSIGDRPFLLVLVSGWSDNGWLSGGHAVRMAVEICESSFTSRPVSVSLEVLRMTVLVKTCSVTVTSCTDMALFFLRSDAPGLA